MIYDVIIVGAGPAGLMAGRTVNNKCNYLIIDSKKEIGLTLKCGEGVKCSIIHELFGRSNFSFIFNKVENHELILRQDKNHKRILKIDYYKLNRPKFEKYLAKGLKINLNEKLKDINIKKNYVEILTNKKKYETKLIILAYGANYFIQKKYNLINEMPELLVCYGGVFKNCNLDKNKFIFYGDVGIAGGFWIFPNNKNKANIGFGALKGNVKKQFYKTLKKFPELKNAKLIKDYSGVVPTSGSIKKNYFNRMLVCGDAASMVYAASGEGISYALISGKIAGETALFSFKKNRFSNLILKQYHKKIKEKIGQELIGGKIHLDLFKLAYKYNFTKSLFNQPNDKELKDIVEKGIFPLRARFIWHITKLFNLNKEYWKKSEMPFILKFSKNIYKLFK